MRFQGVPIELFRETALLRLANTLGRAIRVDLDSDEVARGKCARVCVELDLSQPLVSMLLALGRVVRVEYEGLPKIYYQCGVYGHRSEDCPTMQAAPPEPARLRVWVRPQKSRMVRGCYLHMSGAGRKLNASGCPVKLNILRQTNA